MLDDLLQGSLEDAARRRAEAPTVEVERLALAQAPALDAVAALSRGEQVNIIAEVKRASPSRGRLANIPDPAALASLYECGGAAAISVLTEERKFLGSLDDLRAVREAVSIPVLRKEFIGEEYQILEARAAGADLILLIVASLEQPLLARLKTFAEQLGMTVLVEAHTREEFQRGLDVDAKVLGVNARDLKTFEMHPELFGELAPEYPAGVVRVAESAVLKPEHVRAYRDAGADAVLVGEALVTGDDPEATIKEFLQA
ncbi:indole-3-glycerol phosphate synthase TrpC [Gulosibacter molinativorax]|uniref:indole-3-glycerol-phosphate synthase n=1 Tax=Gulosibacter molinativorax TaxID=256821 RepID=A0ABT7C8J4_9MICO|nr:indole-3-glycerol phosphate synthase TrpC [Gulosibacter molinativorax]MDJ1371084.1 indole-3-glycerol phosphate synthase TrpC [Gulosibacter molinativorax]QUY61444.1 Indole-3-glycerol phosphate synthase [Gulosibacter molinativorax]